MRARLLCLSLLLLSQNALAGTHPAWAARPAFATQRGAVDALVRRGLQGRRPSLLLTSPHLSSVYVQELALILGSLGAEGRVHRFVKQEEANGKWFHLEKGQVPYRDFYAAHLLARLKGMGLDRSQASQLVVHVGDATVQVPRQGDLELEQHRVYVNVFGPKPGVKLSGIIWSQAPGFEMASSNFDALTAERVAKGDIVYSYHQPFAGLTTSPSGIADLGDVQQPFILARDNIAVARVAQAHADSLRGKTVMAPRVFQLGTSLGGGPTLFGAEALHALPPDSVDIPILGVEAGGRFGGARFKAQDLRDPPQHNGVYYSAFFDQNSSVLRNAEIDLLTHVGLGAAQIELPDVIQAADPALRQWLGMDDELNGVQAKARVLSNVIAGDHGDFGVPLMLAILQESSRRHPVGPVYAVHAKNDHLALYGASRVALNILKPSREIVWDLYPGDDHIVPFKAFIASGGAERSRQHLIEGSEASARADLAQ